MILVATKYERGGVFMSHYEYATSKDEAWSIRLANIDKIQSLGASEWRVMICRVAPAQVLNITNQKSLFDAI